MEYNPWLAVGRMEIEDYLPPSLGCETLRS